MKLTRQELDDLLVDYLYDELEPAQRAAFEAGLDEHPELAAEVEAHRRTRSMAAGLPSFALPPGLLDGVLAEAEHVAQANAAAAEKRPSFFERLTRLLMQPAFASAALAVVIFGVGIIYVAQPRNATNDPNAQRLEPVVAPRPTAAEPMKADEAAARGAQGATSPVAEPLEAEGAAFGLADDPTPPPEPVAETDDGYGEAGEEGAAALERPAPPSVAPAASVSKETVSKDTGAKRAAPRPTAAKPAEEAKAIELDHAAPGLSAGKAGGAPTLLSKVPDPAPPGTASVGGVAGGDGAASAPKGGSAATGSGASAGDQKEKDAAAAPDPAVGTGGGGPAAPPVGPAPERVLREVPIPVPSDDDANRAVKTSDRKADGTAEPRAPTPPEDTPAPSPGRDAPAPDAPDSGDSADDEQAAQKVSVERAESGYSRSAEDEARRAEAARKAAEEARIAELWKRYDRYVAAERWSDAEEVLDELGAIPSQSARVRALRPQLARRRAAAEAERASRAKQPVTKQPTTDSTYK